MIIVKTLLGTKLTTKKVRYILLKTVIMDDTIKVLRRLKNIFLNQTHFNVFYLLLIVQVCLLIKEEI